MAAERSVSILGLGRMGSALARAYVKSGWKTIVWNRSTAKAESLIAMGAIAAQSATECVTASRLVITCLLDHKALQKIFANVKPHPDDGVVLVDYTSGGAAETQETQRMIEDLHISAYIRGVVCSTPAYVGTPGSSFYYSGNPEAFKVISDDIGVLGKPRYIGSDPCSATVHEGIIVNTLFGLIAGFIQSMAVLKKSNFFSQWGAERFVSEALGPVIENDYLNMIKDYARQIDKEQYTTTDGAECGLVVHSLEALKQQHSELGIDSVVVSPLQELIKTRIAQGGAGDELSSLVEVISDSQKNH